MKEARDPLKDWLAKYTPVEREILTARAKRLEKASRRRESEARRFGDLCEATEGRAVLWRRVGTPLEKQLVRADGDVRTLNCLALCYGLRVDGNALPLGCLAQCCRQRAGRTLDRLRHQVKRPLYYAAEQARRHALAEARRRITRRTTENARPTREAILDAWTHRRDSPAAAILFGGLLEDLECYLDNALRFDEHGGIVGRNGGIKRWLQEEIPALFLRYATVMRYKAAARKLRQAAGLSDPASATRLVAPDLEGCGKDRGHPSAAVQRDEAVSDSTCFAIVPRDRASVTAERDVPLALVRARAIWSEVKAGVAPSATALMARLDALLDPKRTEEAHMLASWRARYENEITLRTKSRWWRRLT